MLLNGKRAKNIIIFLSYSSGTTNSFSLVALTKHSIGNSRPSRTLKVKCPATPPRVDEVFQVDTNQLGVVLLTWQVPSRTEQDAEGTLFPIKSESKARFTFAVFVALL